MDLSESLTRFATLWQQATDEQKRAALAALSGADDLDLLTLNEAMTELRVSRSTIWRMMKHARLPFVEILPGVRKIRRSAIRDIIRTGDFARTINETRAAKE